jgi:hypothetical protein
MFWKVDVILDYFYKVLLATYLERNFSKEKLVSHDSDIPDIHLAIILLSFNHLRWWIQWSPTMRFPKQWWVDRPSKITYFSQILKIIQNIHYAKVYSKVWYHDVWYHDHACTIQHDRSAWDTSSLFINWNGFIFLD